MYKHKVGAMTHYENKINAFRHFQNKMSSKKSSVFDYFIFTEVDNYYICNIEIKGQESKTKLTAKTGKQHLRRNPPTTAKNLKRHLQRHHLEVFKIV